MKLKSHKAGKGGPMQNGLGLSVRGHAGKKIGGNEFLKYLPELGGKGLFWHGKDGSSGARELLGALGAAKELRKLAISGDIETRMNNVINGLDSWQLTDLQRIMAGIDGAYNKEGYIEGILLTIARRLSRRTRTDPVMGLKRRLEQIKTMGKADLVNLVRVVSDDALPLVIEAAVSEFGSDEVRKILSEGLVKEAFSEELKEDVEGKPLDMAKKLRELPISAEMEEGVKNYLKGLSDKELAKHEKYCGEMVKAASGKERPLLENMWILAKRAVTGRVAEMLETDENRLDYFRARMTGKVSFEGLEADPLGLIRVADDKSLPLVIEAAVSEFGSDEVRKILSEGLKEAKK